jgi:hypothetical protein
MKPAGFNLAFNTLGEPVGAVQAGTPVTAAGNGALSLRRQGVPQNPDLPIICSQISSGVRGQTAPGRAVSAPGPV